MAEIMLIAAYKGMMPFKKDLFNMTTCAIWIKNNGIMPLFISQIRIYLKIVLLCTD